MRAITIFYTVHPSNHFRYVIYLRKEHLCQYTGIISSSPMAMNHLADNDFAVKLEITNVSTNCLSVRDKELEFFRV
ncbi:MAG: hypothetical protein WBB28_21750 [Crinalium sp.]